MTMKGASGKGAICVCARERESELAREKECDTLKKHREFRRAGTTSVGNYCMHLFGTEC